MFQKRFALAAALACTLALAACVDHPSPLPAPALSSSVKLDILKAEITAETAFNAAVNAKNQAEASGLLKGADAAKADAIAKQAYAALRKVRAAANLGVNPDLTALNALVVELATLAKPAS